MKKFILALSILALTSFSALAEDISLKGALESMPALKPGMAYSMIDNKLNYLMTAEVVNFGKYVNLEVGYAGVAQETNHKVVGVLSVNLIEVGAIKFPILKYIKFNPGVYAGLGMINVKDIRESEFDWGISSTLFEIKY